ncbi:hypothetical protein [Microbacterium lacticum]
MNGVTAAIRRRVARALESGGGHKAHRFSPRERTAVGNQLLLCGIVVVMFVVGLATGALPRAELFALGVLIVAIGTIAALAVPWARTTAGWIAASRSSTSSRS